MEAYYFTATWCQPCKVFGPVMEKVRDMVTVKKIDIAESPIDIDTFGIMSVPTVVFLRDGDELGRLMGAQTEQTVRDFITDLGE